MLRYSFIVAALCVGLSSPVWAETAAEKPVEEAIVSHKDLDRPAIYPGGPIYIARDITKAFKYPRRDVEMGNEGTVQVKFIVEADGTIKHMEIVQGQTLTMNEEALRLVSSLKPFSPAMKDGKPVRSALILPIKFKLESYHPEN